MEPNLQKIESPVRELLVELGENPDREGLVKTPLRVAQTLSVMLTSSVLGVFREHLATREEFLSLLGRR